MGPSAAGWATAAYRAARSRAAAARSPRPPAVRRGQGAWVAATPHPWHTVTVTADGWLGKFREILGQKDAEWMQNGTEFSGAKEENIFVNML